MPKFNLSAQANLSEPWRSRILSTFGTANFKVMRMSADAYPEETHQFAEGLLVIDGQMNLSVAGEAVAVSSGELYVVPQGVPHSVLPDSHGILVVLDDQAG